MFFIQTHHNCCFPFGRVLFSLEFLAPTLVLDTNSLVVSSGATCFSWFLVSSDGVSVFLLWSVFDVHLVVKVI